MVNVLKIYRCIYYLTEKSELLRVACCQEYSTRSEMGRDNLKIIDHPPISVQRRASYCVAAVHITVLGAEDVHGA